MWSRRRSVHWSGYAGRDGVRPGDRLASRRFLPTVRLGLLLLRIQGRGGVYHAGAWTRYGFHEDGLLSALRVAQAMGIEWPLGIDPWAEEAEAA